MHYLLLLYDEDSANPSAPPMPDDDRAQMMTAFAAFTQACKDRGVYVGGDALQNVATATTVRVRDGRTVTTDGPFAETKEALGGYYLLDCRDLDEALELAARCPGAAYGSIEVRPVWEMPARVAPEASEAGAARGADH